MLKKELNLFNFVQQMRKLKAGLSVLVGSNKEQMKMISELYL